MSDRLDTLVHVGWTTFRVIATINEFTTEACDHDGPACYELAIAGPRGGDLRIVYVGETQNERARMTCYGRDGSHLSKIIRQHLRNGWHLYYRGWATPTKKAAITLQNRLLSKSRYDWNIQLNGD